MSAATLMSCPSAPNLHIHVHVLHLHVFSNVVIGLLLRYGHSVLHVTWLTYLQSSIAQFRFRLVCRTLTIR